MLSTVIVYSITSPGLTFPIVVLNVSSPFFFTAVAVFSILIPGAGVSGVVSSGSLGVGSSSPGTVAYAMLLIVVCVSISSCVTVYFVYSVAVSPTPKLSISVTSIVQSTSEYTGKLIGSSSDVVIVSVTGMFSNVTFPVFVTVIV